MQNQMWELCCAFFSNMHVCILAFLLTVNQMSVLEMFVRFLEYILAYVVFLLHHDRKACKLFWVSSPYNPKSVQGLESGYKGCLWSFMASLAFWAICAASTFRQCGSQNTYQMDPGVARRKHTDERILSLLNFQRKINKTQWSICFAPWWFEQWWFENFVETAQLKIFLS